MLALIEMSFYITDHDNHLIPEEATLLGTFDTEEDAHKAMEDKYKDLTKDPDEYVDKWIFERTAEVWGSTYLDELAIIGDNGGWTVL